MGYGVVENEANNISMVDCGVVKCARRSPIGERLVYIYDMLTKIINRYHPDAAAIEKPFVAENVKTALAIGQAQAVAILVAATNKVPVYEYTPAQIKRQVANYGASSKKQIQEVIRLELGLPRIPEPPDAADALAVAICHLQEVHLNSLLSREP
jgi:crossover junction endodeoxyribonuclease RuvC